MAGDRSRRLAAATALLVAAATGGAAAWATRGPPGQSDHTLTSSATSPAPTGDIREASRAWPSGASRGQPSTSPSRAATPARVTVKRLGADLPVVALGVDRNGQMALPDSSKVAAWYRFGPDPGGPSGAVVISSHVDTRTDGTGPLARIGQLRRDDPITVYGQDGSSYRYRVERVVRIDKGDLDTGMLFARSGPPRLHLITCGGRFDRSTGHYEQNVIAVATADRP